MADVTNRSPLSLAATLCWVLIFVAVSAVVSPGWLGEVVLLTLALVGVGVLWNLEAISAAWREDRASKRNQRTR